MMFIKSSWMIGGHTLILSGIYTATEWNKPGRAACLLNCTTCDEWWPLDAWFTHREDAIYSLKRHSAELHRIKLSRTE